MNRWWLVAGCVVLLAGCGGLTDDPNPTTPTITPAPTPQIQTATPTPAPGPAPGLSRDGVVDSSRLATAHLAAIQGRSYVWRENRSERTALAGSTVTSNSSKVLRVEDERHYAYWSSRREISQSGNDRYLADYTVYTAGSQRYRRYYEPGNTEPTFDRRRGANATHVHGRTAAGMVTLFLDLPNATVVERERDGRRYYRVSGQRDSIPAVGSTTDATVRATVTPAGFVRSMNASYRLSAGNRTERVHYRYRYTNVGNVSVERPEWVDTQWKTAP